MFFVTINSFFCNAQIIYEDNFDKDQGWSTFNAGITNNTFCIIDSVYSINGNSLQVCSVIDKLYNQIDVLQSGYTYASGLQSEIKYKKIPTDNFFNIQLVFDWKCNGEEGTDFGTLHYSIDAENWQVLKTYQSGKGNEVMTEKIKLPKCSENGSFYIGFSFTSDNSFNFQPGLVVDNLKVYGDKCLPSQKPSQPIQNKTTFTYCFNDVKPVNLTTSTTGSLRWYSSNESCSEILYEGKDYSILPKEYTTFYVTTYNPTSGCESVNKSQVVLNVLELPKLLDTTIISAKYGQDGSIEAYVSGVQPLVYQWSLNSDPNFSSDKLLLEKLDMGNYQLTVTDANKCQDSFRIIVLSGADLDIPKGISPNNDGLNDTWMITGIQQWEDFSVELRNMRGEIVYRQDATDNPSYVPMDGRDATGNILPPGDYTYVVRSKSRKRNYSGILSIKYD
jgi:gliding motility-associated-like protein